MKKKIVFIKKEPRWRIYKIAKALKKTENYQIFCICENLDLDLFNEIFDEIYFYNNSLSQSKFFGRINEYYKVILKDRYYSKIIAILNMIQPDTIHCMAEPYDIIEYLIRNTNYPVVLDAVDFSGISSGIKNLSRKVLLSEKYCFENASGICHKGPQYEINYYINHGYKINCPQLTWMDYCDNDFFVNKANKDNDKTKLVYAGNISTDPQYTYIYYVPLAKMFAKQKLYFYLYVNPFQYKTSEEYKELDDYEAFFHFQKSVSFDKLTKEISNYDWGLWIHPVWGQKQQSRVILDKQKVAIGNKLFSYLEAGLPVIVSDHLEYGKTIVEKYKIGFSIKDEELPFLREKIENVNYDELKENVLLFRKEFSLKNKVGDLEKFYDQVIEKSR